MGTTSSPQLLSLWAMSARNSRQTSPAVFSFLSSSLFVERKTLKHSLFVLCVLSYLLYCTAHACAWVRNLVILLEQSTAIYLPVGCYLCSFALFYAGPILVKQMVKETTCALVVSYERNKAIAFFTHSSLVLLQYIDVSSKLLNKFHLLRLAISVHHLSFICSPLTAASLSPEDISVSTYHKGGPGNRQFQNQLEIFLLPLFLPRSFL